MSITWLRNLFLMESVFCPEVLSECWSQLCAIILVCPFLVQYTLHTGSILIKFSPISTVHFLLSVGSNGGKKNLFKALNINISSPLNFHACVRACACVVSSITCIEFRQLWATVLFIGIFVFVVFFYVWCPVCCHSRWIWVKFPIQPAYAHNQLTKSLVLIRVLQRIKVLVHL